MSNLNQATQSASATQDNSTNPISPETLLAHSNPVLARGSALRLENIHLIHPNDEPIHIILELSAKALGRSDYTIPLSILEKQWVSNCGDLRLLIQEDALRSIGLPIRLCVWLEEELNQLVQTTSNDASLTTDTNAIQQSIAKFDSATKPNQQLRSQPSSSKQQPSIIAPSDQSKHDFASLANHNNNNATSPIQQISDLQHITCRIGRPLLTSLIDQQLTIQQQLLMIQHREKLITQRRQLQLQRLQQYTSSTTGHEICELRFDWSHKTDFDTNGILYWLGCNGLQQLRSTQLQSDSITAAYLNPVLRGAIAIETSGLMRDSQPAYHMLDH
jgi:hypothetical protein